MAVMRMAIVAMSIVIQSNCSRNVCSRGDRSLFDLLAGGEPAGALQDGDAVGGNFCRFEDLAALGGLANPLLGIALDDGQGARQFPAGNNVADALGKRAGAGWRGIRQ